MASRKKTPARKAATRGKAVNRISVRVPADIAKQLHDIVAAAIRAATTAVVSPQANELTPPPIGQYWKGQGGVYVGIRRAVIDGVETFYHLIDGAISDTDMTFDAAGKFISAYRADGHADFVRPNQGDGRLIDANLDRKGLTGLFWLTQHAGTSSTARAQTFSYGDQVTWLKHNELRARAVRTIKRQ